MISGRDGSSHINMRLSTKQLISCALVNIAAAICVQWWPGEEISIWSKQCGTTMYHATKKSHQVASSTDIEYIRPIQGTHYFFFLLLLRHLQKSRIGNLSAFPNLTGWLASDIYWKVEWAKTKSEGSWLSRQAGTGTETTADQMESSRCHAREKQVWRSRLRLRVQTSETVDLQNEQYRNC